jgi:hypothetical protein
LTEPPRPHQPAPITARAVGDVRPDALIDAEAVDEPIERALYRIDGPARIQVVLRGCR